MRKFAWLAVVVLLPLVVLGGCKQATTTQVATPAPVELKAYVPCGMIIPMRAVMDAFKVQYPRVTVTGVFDNSGIIVDRLTKKNEKADVVVTPGNVELKKLEEGGIVAPGTAKAVGDFELVIIVPASSKLEIKTPADLKKCKTIACPNNEVNSTGASGEEALKKLGLWDELKPKMVFTTHAIEAHTLVASGKADAGIAYKNCPLETNPEKLSKSKVRIAFSFPADIYTRQRCWVALTKAAKMPEAQQFLTFITSPDGLKLLEEKGMTNCLSLAEGGACPVPASGEKPEAAAAKPATDALVKVVAYYPNNEGHAKIKKAIEGLAAKYGGKVSGEFVDFTSDEGFKKWQEAGLTCGGILIDGQQTWTYDKAGKATEITFKMAEGGEWTWADLDAVLKKALAAKAKK